MKNKYNCISVVGITRAILLALFVVLPNVIFAQQSPSIQTGVSFQWADTQTNLSDAATIQSVTIGGIVYNTFVVPTSYELTRLGPDGHNPNRIKLNGGNVGGNSSGINWNTDAISAFQDKNLNHYFTANPNGRDICSDFNAATTTDAQKQTIFYSPAIPSNEGGVLAVTERGGNNCFYIEAWGIPVGGGSEQRLGRTFIRNVGNYTGCTFEPPTAGSDYWKSGRCNENGQTIGIGLFYLDDIAPTGSRITKIEFIAASRDHGDGKFFILQKYAVDQQNINCIDTKYSGDLSINNNVPDNSTYSLVSGPTPAGQSFTLDSDGTYSYIPTNGFTGEITFEYEVCLPAPNNTVCDRATATINFVDLPPIPEGSISCGSGNDDFTISITNPLGAEFEYSLNGGAYQASPDFDNLPEGSYTISIRSAFTTCENMNTMPFVLDNLELTGSVTDVLCKLEETGAIDISASGGAPPYTYAWSNSATSEDLTDLFGGTFTVTVTDANGCTITDDFTVNQPTDVLASTITITNVLCNGDNNGEIDLSISGGTAPYSVLWNNGSTNQDLSGLAAGNYSVTITDANGCTSDNQVTISQPNNVLAATLTNQENVDCNGNSTGNILVEGSGGTPPYNYSLDGGATSQTNGLFENLAAGSYSILITDANNCTTTLTASITQPTILEISITNVNDVDCSGEATGDITTNVVGGTQPYSYSWSNSSIDQNLTDVIAGTYIITITDANGCSISANATISEPATPLSINISKVDANTAQGCTNGEATADVSGGTPPYTYQWSPSANNQTTLNATNLPVGNHSVTITDANGCQLTQSVVIVCVNTCDAEITIGTITNVLCVGDTTGSGTVTASSDANPGATFTFTWSNGQVDSGVTSSTLNGVTAGVYDVSVTIDGTVCQPVEETISITEPINALNLTATSTDELGPGTADGTASATATGGVEPYTYLWSPGGETTQDISDLAAGTYTVTVTDDNGCTETATIVVNPGTCNNLSISGTSTAVACNGQSNGSVTAIVSNGVGPFTYVWDSLPDTASSVSDLPAGSYTVTVTDQTTLCTQSTTITINEPNALSTGIAVTNILCNGDSTGTVDLTVNGGTSPYTFLWNTGATTEDIINVEAGTYSVTVTDANGCTTTNQSTVLEPAEAVSGIIAQITNAECLGENTGSLTAEGSGGIPPYIYSINNGASTQSSGLFENLAAGSYTILIIDANGCTFNVNATIETDDTENPEITVPTAITIEGCATTDITNVNAVFSYSVSQSGDIQSTFVSNPDYNASDDFNIQSITYIDVITSTNNCPITVLRTFTITDNCNNTVTATQTITVQDTTPPSLSLPSNVTIECTEDETSANTGTAAGMDNCSAVTITESDVITASCGNTKTIIRTWTATDECGNETSADQTITVQDTTPPTIIVPSNITIECSEDESSTNTGEATGSDTCGNLTISQSDFEKSVCGNTKIIIRTWTATDECGNETSANQTITVQDTTPPTLTVPTDVTIECTEDESSTNTGEATGSDTCGNVTITQSDSETAACGNTKTIVRTWTATDACGNAISADQIITVEDTTPPTITVPEDVTIECTEDESSANTGEANGSDTCGSVTISQSDDVTTTCGNTRTIVRTWTVTDQCGNESSLNQTIIIQDTTPPTISVPVDVTIECTEDESSANTGEATGSDTCGTVTISQSDVETAACGNTKTIIRTWTATDECGNETSANQTITVQDTTPPTLTLPADITIECTEDESSANTGEATGSDTCGTITISQSDLETAACGNTKTILRTWTVTDECGNATSADQTITVQDTAPPTIDTSGIENIDIQCGVTPDGTLEAWLLNNAGATATDTCGTVTWSNDFGSNTDVDCASGDITVTFTATDTCDNIATTTATYSIIDTVDPILTIPTDVTIECTEDITPTNTGTATATDDCASPMVTFNDSEVAACGNTMTITRTWTATDACGNTTSADQTITVQDTTPPTLIVPADVAIECTEDETSANTGEATGTDTCGTVTISQSDIETAACGNTKTIVRTWIATDECGNETSAEQTITVQDTTPPTFTVPADITIECDIDVNDLTNTGDVIDENDSCDTNLEATYSDVVAAGSCANESVITRTWSLTDECDNTTTLVQTINVVDTTPPTFTAPADMNLECDVDVNDLTITGDVIDETDNCDTDLEAVYKDIITTGNCPGSFIINRKWTLVDNCDNVATALQIIRIEDTTPPTFTVPTDVTIECDVDTTDLTLTGDVTDEADNCASDIEATYTDNVTAGSCANASIITRTWSLSDECDNTTTLVQTINVVDTTAPTFTVPADITIECDVDVINLTLTGDVVDEADNCDSGLEATYTDSIADGNCANESIITRTWSLSDACDNTTTLIQTITIQDTTAPTFTVPADVTIECDVDTTDLSITGEVTDESDNCSIGLEATYTDATVDGNCINSYTIQRTWTLEDECDNVTTLVQTITVQDTTAPTFTVPIDITVECDVDVNDLSITGSVSDEADNCSTGMVATFTDSVAAGSCANESVITRTWSLADDCDNTTVLIQTITVQDTAPPEFDMDALPADLTVECDAIPDPGAMTLTATDNCGDATVTVVESTTAGTCANEYTLIRTWTATDDCGNEAIHIQTISVQDTTAPLFNETLPADIDAECDAVPTAETLTATDTCSGDADVTFSETTTEGACVGDFIIERTWNATDTCGNEAVHTQIITVQDTTAPALVTPFDENKTVTCDDIPAVPDLVFEDSCSNDISVVFDEVSTQVNTTDDYSIIRTWTLTDDCGNESQFVQTITVEIGNVISATDTNRCILDIEFDLFDLLSGDFDMDGTWSVVSGVATLNGSIFDPTTVEVGVYMFKYAITEGSCPTEVEVTVTIDDDCVVLACGEEDVVISKTVTANGDTINDVFEISGIDDCNFVIELQIFNRWGAEIYKNNNYQNNWGGEAHGSSVGRSGFVPTGTYYYIINLRDSGLKPFAGPIYVATNK